MLLVRYWLYMSVLNQCRILEESNIRILTSSGCFFTCIWSKFPTTSLRDKIFSQQMNCF